MFDIRGQQVKFPVIQVRKTALGAERRACMTLRAYINNFCNS